MNYTVDAVVVEGSHDKITLELLGYKKSVLMCSVLSHTVIVDQTVQNFLNVVILTDFDEQGKFLNKKFVKLFESRGVKVDHFYRRKFQKLFKEAKISTIENIYNIKRSLRGRPFDLPTNI